MKKFCSILTIGLLLPNMVNSKFDFHTVKRQVPSDGKCRAIALAGGGTRGAYEIGALKGMIDSMPDYEMAYDVMAGVSIGALTANTIGMFDIGDERTAIDHLLN
jgi:hypothetical protein